MSQLVHPISTRYRISIADHGTLGIIGNVSQVEPGMWRLHFVPDASFVGGGVAILGTGEPDDSGEMNFGSVPYRRWQIGGVASDGTLVQTSSVAVPLTQDSIVYVPATGLKIAVSFDITAGFGYLYSLPILGHPGF